MPALLKTKAIQVIDACENVHGDSPLFMAIKNGNRDMCEILLRAGAKTEIEFDEEKKDALKLAEEFVEFNKLKQYWDEQEKPSPEAQMNRKPPGKHHVRNPALPAMDAPNHELTLQFIKDWYDGKIETQPQLSGLSVVKAPSKKSSSKKSSSSSSSTTSKKSKKSVKSAKSGKSAAENSAPKASSRAGSSN